MSNKKENTEILDTNCIFAKESDRGQSAFKIPCSGKNRNLEIISKNGDSLGTAYLCFAHKMAYESLGYNVKLVPAGDL